MVVFTLNRLVQISGVETDSQNACALLFCVAIEFTQSIGSFTLTLTPRSSILFNSFSSLSISALGFCVGMDYSYCIWLQLNLVSPWQSPEAFKHVTLLTEYITWGLF